MGRESVQYAEIARTLSRTIAQELNVRISRELLELAALVGRRCGGGWKIMMKLKRKQISQMVGCSHESAVRIMSRWEKEGWIRTENKYITIRRPDRLRSLLSG